MTVRAPLKSRIVIKALYGTYGNISALARILGRHYSTVYGYMKRAPEEVQEALRQEKERMADIAEKTVEDMMSQRLDFGVASRTARWYLERKHADRGYIPKKQTTIEGGKNPIQVQHEHLVAIEKIKTLSIEQRKEMLKEIEISQVEVIEGDEG